MRVQNTGTAKLVVKELIYEVETSTVFIATHTNKINTS